MLRTMRYCHLFLMMLLPFLAPGQHNFTLKLSAADLKGDSLIIGAPLVKMGFEDFYDFEMENVTDIKLLGWMPFSSYYLKLSGEDVFKGKVADPLPVALIYLNPDVLPRITDVFFLEPGDHALQLPKLEHKQKIEVSSPVNREYRQLRDFLKPVYTKADNPFQVDSLINFPLKKKLLTEYIRQHPDSYPAFWEVTNDYSLYQGEGMNFDILNEFSDDFKKNRLYRLLKTKIDIENKTGEGSLFPEVGLGPALTFGSSFFSRHRITLIDYWSTTCGPCIASMPELVKIYDSYKEKGLHVVAVDDDKTAAAKERAGKLLLKNHIPWDNHFDDGEEFKTKLNASGYPLYFLVDQKGKILYRGSDLETAREIIMEALN